MFGKKTRKRLDRLDRDYSQRIGNLEKTINQLACDHSDTEFRSHPFSPFWIGPTGAVRLPYTKECLLCGKFVFS